MMKTWLKIVLWIVLASLFVFPVPVSAQATKGCWVLTGTWHSEITDVSVEHTNNGWSANAEDGSVTAVLTVTDNHDANNPVTYTFTYTYSFTVQGTGGSDKQKLYPGDEVEIGMTLTYQGVDPQILSGEARIYAGAFGNYPSDNLITVRNPGGSDSKTIKISIPAGTPGAENVIKIHCEGGYQPIEFAYLYQWVDSDAAAVQTSGSASSQTSSVVSPQSVTSSAVSSPEQSSAVKSSAPETDEFVWEDSGARFDSVTGAVEICIDPDEDEWERCTPRTRIPVGAHIRARLDSYAIVRFADMNTYIIKENAEIVVKKPPRQKGQLELLMGKLWSNTKKILNDGSMEIETAQAVAGIKGTTYVLEADAEKTTLKVFEGTVVFTSKVSGNSVEVTAGQQAVADNSNVTAATGFDAQEEAEQWSLILQKAAAQKNLLIAIVIAVVLAAAAGLTVFFIKRSRKVKSA